MVTTKTITFSFENRKIVAGEFHAAFGHNVTIVERIQEHLFLGKSMTATWTDTSATITYAGTLPGQAREDLWSLSNTGIITDLSY